MDGPGYFLFVDNQADPQDLVSQIKDDIGCEWEWTLYNKKPWENTYGQASETDKRKFMLNKVPHTECKDGEAEDIMFALRRWMKSSKATLRFGEHINFVEAITNRSPPG